MFPLTLGQSNMAVNHFLFVVDIAPFDCRREGIYGMTSWEDRTT